ncbi:MAG TPA: hypothetical protein VM409_06655, partial [Chloroflexia bacterium]|nr:hypothetical protein [Chloroflexia bacterium]
MRQNLFAWLIGILIVTLLSGYIVASDRVGIGDMSRDTRFRKGLDLEGGLQLVLQAEPRGNEPLTQGQLNAA